VFESLFFVFFVVVESHHCHIMFAEELTGSAARKRQEKNRARRRQIKAQQQQQQRPAGGGITRNVAAAAAASSSGDSSNNIAAAQGGEVSSPSADVALNAGIGSTPKAGVTASATNAQPSNQQQKQQQQNKKQLSAVEIAAQQRKIRQQRQLQSSSAIKIQSLYRAHTSNSALRDSQGELFDRRLSDLATLGALLTKAGSCADYVPPPATVTVLSVQLLYLTRRTKWNRRRGDLGSTTTSAGSTASGNLMLLPLDSTNMTRLAKYLTLVILPGMTADDDNMDPLLPWLDDALVGRRRVDHLLTLCMEALTGSSAVSTKEVDTTTGEAVGNLFRLVTGADREKRARAAILKYCRNKLILPRGMIDITTPGQTMDTYPGGGEGTGNLDLIRRTRTLLLYGICGGRPIPDNAERNREKCVSDRDRARADRSVSLLLDVLIGVQGKKAASVYSADLEGKLLSRFVEEILSVPLLTWKISAVTVKRLTTPAPAPGTNGVIPFVDMLRAFASQHAEELSRGGVRSILPTTDVPPTKCPALAVMCLLANAVQMGQVCVPINGSDPKRFDFRATNLFFLLMASLVDSAPIGSLSSRHSAVEWVSHGTHSTPIVLSVVVIDQCKALVIDSYVRNLFKCAIDEDIIGVDSIISDKNSKDKKYEDEMAQLGGTSAASLAAREARVDRTRGFWQSSKWANKLSKGMNSLLSGGGEGNALKKSSGQRGEGKLVNTSTISRQLANGSGSSSGMSAIESSYTKKGQVKEKKDVSNSSQQYSTTALFALCRTYGCIIARWGGSGKADIVGRASSSSSSRQSSDVSSSDATDKADPLVQSLLNVMCFSTPIVKTLWAIIQSDQHVVSDLYALIDENKASSPIRCLTIRPRYERTGVLSLVSRRDDGNLGSTVLYVFLCCLAHALILTDDIELHDMNKPLPPHQIRRCVLVLKKLLYRACCLDSVKLPKESSSSCVSNYFGLALIAAASRTMRDMYDRSSRRPLCPPKLWLVEDLLEKEIRRCKSRDDYVSLLSLPVLRVCPFLVSFKRRLRLFERIVTTDRISIQGSNDTHDLQPGVAVRIMRGRVLEDGLIHLNNLGGNLRRRIVVQYISHAGTTETGVDVGGLFKEFWADLSNLAFDPNFALFKATEGSGNCLYPSPSSRTAHGSDHIVLYEFLGRILGKALYEGITIQPQFAHFFLSFLRGDYNFLHMLPDLSTMDPQLYNNLMFLKTYEGDASDLCLSFTVAKDDFGGNEEVPLIPNGADVEVTNANKHRYIGLVAKYHVNDRVREQSEAFVRGLWEVIDRRWLLLFNEPELQVLISGASDGKIDVADMKAHARYTGGYTGLDKHVYRFWNVVSSFSSVEQAELLRFVTSCERPPPLGFMTLNPPFTIQRVGILRDGDKLPSASTCFNTLKLPTYSSEKVLKQRLLYAIKAGAGFELT